MRILAVLLMWALCAPVWAKAQDRLVVVELFTSQGCSSCPPADALMHELAKDPMVLPLGMHVDYWDYIGWKDSFGSAQFSQRQRDYAQARSEKHVFTPQMMINGVTSVVGNKVDHVKAEIARHKENDPILKVSRMDDMVRLHTPSVPGPYVVSMVRYTPRAAVDIDRGENAGREITYTNVVTEWTVLGKWTANRGKLFDIGRDLKNTAILVQREGFGEIVAAVKLDQLP
ncbi:MAG: DUF1223 domain-containing protein [Planktomarina sp.]